MEGLIPYLIHAIKRQKLHQHSFRCLSDGSRRSYHLLANANDSFSGSSHHRRTQSEFVPPASMDFQPEVEEYVRSRSFKSSGNNNNNNDNSNYRLRQAQYSGVGYGYGHPHNSDSSSRKGLKKAHQN
uniref:Uncharacterized protein n=1 Tax=Opuntia streptacantha TaxID=393608 RepID=A0A7C8ZIU7_OPUST